MSLSRENDAEADMRDPAPGTSGAFSGVVLQGTGGLWEVFTADRQRVQASMRGRLKHEAHGSLKLAVGDVVSLRRDNSQNDAWVISDIHPRRSELARRVPGGGHGQRVVVANPDQVLVVFAAAQPEPHPRMLDRFLVIAEANELAVRIVVNKTDLVEPGVAEGLFAEQACVGYPIHYVSARSGHGVQELHGFVDGRSSVLAGPSGVGKSSLMNALYPGLGLRTGAVSASVNKGRHTTVGAFLHPLPLPAGGFVADTPGLREVGLWGIEESALADCFPELRPMLGKCRFNDCTHLVEPGCAVREALAEGLIPRGRYESYVKLRQDIPDARHQR